MRKIINLNKNWLFSYEDTGLPSVVPENWEHIELPESLTLTRPLAAMQENLSLTAFCRMLQMWM